MNIYMVAIFIFLISIITIEIMLFAYRTIKNPDRARIRKQLRKITFQQKNVDSADVAPDILRKKVFSDIKSLNDLLRHFTFANQFHKLLYQANAKYSVGFYIILSALLGLSAYLAVISLNYGFIIALPVALLFGISPFLYLRRMKKRRMAKFQKQLPEALNLVARSLRAGHAFSTGLKLAADEFEDPLGPEFEVTLDEINFGVAVPDALRKMTERVDCQDLNFFVVAVILQRETGGNLAQIIENTAAIIRERFAFYGKVKVLSAEGIMSMWVLMGLPFVVAGGLLLLSPDYMKLLIEETIGQIMIAYALIMMVLGYFFMRKMVEIKV
ncbi:tight adherence protein B [Desulfonatronum thiosulfatophilum]|uniref:Tight adherence protein B n=1 Tax=Desulfonatronum thiosulfatophilum TaxID=617002 RepID=A0A1G6C7U4_9BACT|nr:type II secretion system F family protein [Desulfonatronum thiosulfatophilum]SDB28980.1 tight adherence protein B [Desulfonatronum thiosulfatophilum]